MQEKTIKFANKTGTEFIGQLRKRVDEYFLSQNISKNANGGMVVKTIFMLLLYFGPYALLLSGIASSLWAIWLLWALMGIGMSGIGLAVMHDANHGAYSSHKWVNTLLGYFLNVIGGSAINWKMQHNVLHHSFTNIDGMDEDISITKILRFSPHQKLKKIHRFQHLYAWFLYSLMTIDWISYSDFAQLKRYHRKGLTRGQSRPLHWLYVELIISKMIYFSYTIVLPLLFFPGAWWQILIGFLMMQLICGFILASIFQPAHVVPTSEYPLPDFDGKIENSWAIHQISTTSDFAPRSRFFSWFVGGLNFQVEHHLFPNICHIHYKKIAEIVKETTHEFGLPYHVMPTFFSALINHGRMLKLLSR